MIKKIVLALSVLFATVALAEEPLKVQGEFIGNAGTKDLAPYFIMSNNGGIVTQHSSALFRASAVKDLDLSRRFSYSFGVDALAGYSDKAEYLRYSVADKGMVLNESGPAPIWLQQLFAEVKFRGVFITVGMKERHSPLFNSELGSGDFIQSNNARPVPEVRAGFIDFQNVPFTNGWLQIQGELSYGKYVQNDWLRDHYGYQRGFINTGVWTHYKRLYLRSKPAKPFSVTVGMQVYSQFGGTCDSYSKGELINSDPYDVKLKDFFKIFTMQGGDDNDNPGDSQYYYGNTLGSWDFIARYRLKNDSELKAYFQWPFEDGSGIGKMNGFDGIWGLEYNSHDKSAIVSSAVLEYIDFTNQSGPSHWAPADVPDSEMGGEATGGDSYYNNFRYNSFMNFGMSQGTPFIPGTIYNKDGQLQVRHNRIRGFHLGVAGNIIPRLQYRLLFSYRKSWGTYSSPLLEKVDDTSFMIEGKYNFKQVKDLSLKAALAFDKGKLLGDNFGAMVTLNYTGVFKIFER